jgi:hypothetical protein
MITLAGLLIDNPRDELRPGGHDVPPSVEDRPQPYSGPKHHRDGQSYQDREPTPLNSPDIVLGALALRDKAFTLGQSLLLLIGECRRSFFACCQK